MPAKLVITGAAGRMGKRIAALAAEDENFEIAGAIERPEHPDVGKDIGLLAGAGELGINVKSQYPDDADLVIDFSEPQSAEKTLDYCLEKNAALVMGTTGLDTEQQLKLDKACEQIPLIYGTNMSVGMNVMFTIVGKVAKMLGSDYDIEIVEHHHRFKKDSPSGSALTLAENICIETQRNFPDCIVNGRSGKSNARTDEEIGVHAVRAGDITGRHSVLFATKGETITLNHTATNRDNFVIGALRAGAWLVRQKPGRYSMADVLGLND